MTAPAFLLYLLGCTNAGKTTFIDAAPADWGRVEVGKQMRAKYPPSHFAGQSNPAHTALEAWAMYEDGIAAAERNGATIILIDGQPRDARQCEAILKDDRHSGRRMFLHLWAPPGVLAMRARARDGGDSEKMALTTARLVNDIPPIYNILCRLQSRGELVIVRDTSASDWSLRDAIMDAGLLGMARMREVASERERLDDGRQGGL